MRAFVWLAWIVTALVPFQRAAAQGTGAPPQVVAGDYIDISTGPSGAPLTGSVVAVAAAADGSFYVAGQFATRQSDREALVMRWSSSGWVEIGRPSFNSNAPTDVNALVVGRDGSLYAGGRFDRMNGVLTLSIARWNGAEWRPVGGNEGLPGIGGEVQALAIAPGGILHAGGRFRVPGGQFYDGVARLDGTEWGALGTGIGEGVRALAFAPNGALYVGGSWIATDDAGNRLYTATYARGRWTPLGGTEAPSGEVLALGIGPGGDLYAGGQRGSQSDSTYVRRWDGQSWTRYGSGFEEEINAFAYEPAGRFFVGTGNRFGGRDNCCLSVWNGSTWQPAEGGTDGAVSALAVGPPGVQTFGKLYVGGTFLVVGDTPSRSAAVLERTGWRAYGSGIGGAVQAFTYGPDGALYAAGNFRTIAGRLAQGVAKWTGSEWEPLTSGVERFGRINTLLFGPDGILYVGGRFTSIGGVSASGVARWDGTSWRALGAGPGPASAFEKDVRDMAFGPDGKLYILGLFDPVPRSLYRWDGASWEAVGGGALVANGGNSTYLSALAFGTDGSLYIGGYFTSVGGVAANHIARWDGATWNPLGGGLTRGPSAGPPTEVLDLDIASDGTVYVAGSFLFAGGQSIENVARWNGSAWSALGSGLNGPVFSIDLRDDGSLYAGGRFTAANNGAPGQVGVWNGEAWRTLPDLIRGDVYAVQADANSQVLIGGAFLTTGDVVLQSVTRFVPSTIVASEDAPIEARTLDLALAPNPSRRASVVTVTHAAGPVTVEVFDGLGRRVASVTEGEAPAGTRTFPLDLSRLAPGLYVVRMQAGAETRTRQLVVVR